MVSKRRSSQETSTLASPKKSKVELSTAAEEELQEVEEEKCEDEEKLEDEGEKEEMEVIDEAKCEDAVEETTTEDKTPKEEYTMDMPDDIEGIPEEAIEKTVKALGRGKIAVLKYVEAIKRIYDIMSPDETKETQDASLTVLKDFKENVNSVKALKLSDETKKAFAYHVEICKSRVPKLFEEAVVAETTEEPTETQVQKLFKKAPKLSIGSMNNVINKVAKITKEKKTLLNELNDLNTKMQIVDNLLCLQVVEENQDEKEAWQFFQENADQIIEVFSSLGATELVILDFCKNIGYQVLEKMSICRKNWTTLGTQLPNKSPSVSSLVNGPLVTVDMLTGENITPMTTETRSHLLNIIAGFKKKVDNNSAGYVKSSMSKEDMESFNYFVNDLEVMIGKQKDKSLLPEEKLYIGYHFSKTKPYVHKIADLNKFKTIVEGTYEYYDKKPEVRKSFGSPRGGRGDSRGSSKGGRGDSRGSNSRGSRGDYKKPRGGVFNGSGGGYRGSNNGFRGRGSSFRGSGGGFQKSFDHYGAY